MIFDLSIEDEGKSEFQLEKMMWGKMACNCTHSTIELMYVTTNLRNCNMNTLKIK